MSEHGGSGASTSASEPAIELLSLRRCFGDRVVLSDVSLSVAEGDTLVVFGPNGAGKSTLLRVLASLLRPHGGGVRVFGHELPAQAFTLRGRVGLLAHEPLLYRELSARENLTFHARLHGVGSERVQELLEAVALGGRGSEPLRELSRGMVQRVAIARAVLHHPRLLLLDEPYANLDPAARALAAELIGPGRGRTRVLCSHDPAGGLAEADFVLGLRDGRVALSERAEDVRESEIAELYR
jgi:heme exporter protein A